MQGKYSNYLQFTAARLHRAACLRTLGRLVEWEPLVDPEPGYSIVHACNTPLAEMLGANLRLLERQRLDHLRQIFVVFDRPSTQIPIPIEAQIRSEFPG
ncbi:MAG TPA: hypothetical protein VLJ39_00360, partial [Tepidisphaeraceae bacterium]|nr:hypothetical protein [Tepidisphaeraceae bacterium]